MKKYEVNFTDSSTGATSAIDTIIAADDYTAADYIRDCQNNAGTEWCEMLASGEIILIEID